MARPRCRRRFPDESFGVGGAADLDVGVAACQGYVVGFGVFGGQAQQGVVETIDDLERDEPAALVVFELERVHWRRGNVIKCQAK